MLDWMKLENTLKNQLQEVNESIMSIKNTINDFEKINSGINFDYK